MAHLSVSLPSEIEIGAVRRTDWHTEVVTTDSGSEVRNNRWATPLRTYDVSFPVSRRDDPVYQQVVWLYQQAEGNLHSFNFTDWADGSVITVRFDGPLATTGVTGELEHIVEVTLIEVRT